MDEGHAFKLDILLDLPRYVGYDTYQTIFDDKSGYDDLLLSVESRTFLGMQWGGWYFDYNTLPFGWKISPFVYHPTGLVVSNFFRSMGIPCSLYIDDEHNGQLHIPPNQGAFLNLDGHNLAAAKSAIFSVAYFLIKLGYFLGLAKSILCLVRLSHFWVSCPTPLERYSILSLKRKRSFLILLNKHWQVQ